MSEQTAVGWNPVPGDCNEKEFYAGYSAGWYRYPFGAGQENPGFDYRKGFQCGQAHRKNAERVQ